MQTATHPAKPAHRANYRPINLGRVVAEPLDVRRTAPRVTVALDAFPPMPPVHLPRDTSNADYWEHKAREHITVLRAALVLHKQLTSGAQVPRSLNAALTASQVRIAQYIKTSIARHRKNGGQRADELTLLWEMA